MVTVKDNTSEVINQLKIKSSIFLREAADEIVKIAQPKTPKEEGRLRADIVRQVLGLKGKVVWGKKYAAYQERGSREDGSRRVRNYTTPGTNKRFAENSVKSTIAKTAIIAKKSGLI